MIGVRIDDSCCSYAKLMIQQTQSRMPNQLIALQFKRLIKSAQLRYLLQTYNYLDLTPKGRNEEKDVAGWERRHDEYER
jgi:hypothetical protein